MCRFIHEEIGEHWGILERLLIPECAPSLKITIVMSRPDPIVLPPLLSMKGRKGIVCLERLIFSLCSRFQTPPVKVLPSVVHCSPMSGSRRL